MLARLYNRIAKEVAYGIVTPNEAREMCGLELIQNEDALVTKNDSKITNCVNCGAAIDPNVDHCEYCGTSYALMGVSSPGKEAECLKVQNRLLASKIDMSLELERLTQRYNDAIRAMGSYARHY